MKYKIITFLLIIIITVPVYAFSPSSEEIYEGIDVSYWQGTIDFEKVKNSGINVVYIRTSEGLGYVDPYFRENYERAKDNGLKVGFYHFLTARTVEEARKEASFFVSTIKGTEPDLKLAMDFEEFGDLSRDEINQISEEFLEVVTDLSGKACVIYSDAYNARATFDLELAKKYPIWVADYFVEEPEGNDKWSTWVGFQYSDRGRINGISGNVDRDKFTSGIFLNSNSKIEVNNTEESIQNSKYIIVKYGDTLSKIAEKYNTSYQYLAKINNIPNPNLIYVGEKILVVPFKTQVKHDAGHRLYTVRRGDTLTWISREYNVSIESIVELNNIPNPNLIYVGQELRIPVVD